MAPQRSGLNVWPYWGSKYGVIGSPDQGYRVLVEANHQRWWVREYTSNTDYRIGQGNPFTGEILVTGRWRCDTYAWWAFYSQGVDTMPGKMWLPRNLFNFFPYYNDERLTVESSVRSSEVLLKPGIVCSGDSFDNNQTDYDIFIKQNCSAVDMEAAGVAWVSMLAEIPMFAIKGITNFVRGNDIHKQYEENYPIVTQNLSRKLEEILKLDNSLLINRK